MSRAVCCPFCKGEDSSVVASGQRGAERNPLPGYRRRRKCTACGHRYSTVEITSEQMDELEKLRAGVLVTELLRSKSAISIAIETLTKVRDGKLI